MRVRYEAETASLSGLSTGGFRKSPLGVYLLGSKERRGRKLKYFFHSLDDFEQRCSRKTLYAFDYDGTLVPLVPHPDQALMTSRTQTLIRTLEMISPIAIVTGRDIKTLKRLMSLEPKHLIGNHGLETDGLFSEYLPSAEKMVAGWASQLEQEMAEGSSASPVKNIWVENKIYTITLHPLIHHRFAEGTVPALLSFLKPTPRVVLGYQCINLLPQFEENHSLISINKGTALLRLMERLGMTRAFYIGDDITDEDVFCLDDKRILSVRVEKKYPSQAEYYIRTQTEIDDLLEVLIDHARRMQAALSS